MIYKETETFLNLLKLKKDVASKETLSDDDKRVLGELNKQLAWIDFMMMVRNSDSFCDEYMKTKEKYAELEKNQIPGRCKDCVESGESEHRMAGLCYCTELHDWVELDHYCGWWEKKDDK